MKMKYYRLLFTLLLILATLGPTSALAAPNVPDLSQTQAESNTARAEQTQWKYKYVNGVFCKRLWSVTYNRWLTEWIPC